MQIHDSILKGDSDNEKLPTGKSPNPYYTQITEDLLNGSYLHLNHYRIQSWELFSSNKMLKGDATSANADKRDKAYFNRFDTNDLKDTELKNKKYALSMRKTRRIKRKRGGTAYYYPYNNKPLLFTNQSNRQQGGFDSRHTLFPSTIVDGLRGIGTSVNNLNAETSGSYKGVDSNWRIQPLK